MSEADESLGARLKRLRVEARLTQEALGAGIYSGAYLSQIEAGKRNPSREAIELFAERLHADPEYLLTGFDPKLPISLSIDIQRARALAYEDPAEALGQLQDLLDRAKHNRLLEVEAKALEALGFAKYRDGAIQDALALFQQGEALSMDSPIHTRCGFAVGIARCFQQLGDPRYAAHVLESYLMQLESEGINDPTALMRVNASLVSVYFATGMLEQAVKAADVARRLEVRVNDPEQVACMNLNVACALLFQGKTADATIALKKSEDIFSSLGWKGEVARAALAQGIIHAKVDALPAAKASLEHALRLLGESPHALDEARTRNELARVERRLGRSDVARAHAEKVFELIPDGDPRERAFASRELGLASAEPQEIERHLKDAVDLYRIANDPIETAATFRALGDHYSAENDTQAMAEAYRSGLEAIESRAY